MDRTARPARFWCSVYWLPSTATEEEEGCLGTSEWSERVHGALNVARRVYVKSARNSAAHRAHLLGIPPPDTSDEGIDDDNDTGKP